MTTREKIKKLIADTMFPKIKAISKKDKYFEETATLLMNEVMGNNKEIDNLTDQLIAFFDQEADKRVEEAVIKIIGEDEFDYVDPSIKSEQITLNMIRNQFRQELREKLNKLSSK